jgi:NAD(P)-dependent dehydrogenase (short-subunit alcohol dehydrogenase family)
VITGAALGLGWEDARQLASEGRRAHLLGFVGPPGFFLGDYMGLTGTGRDFLAVFAQPHDNDPASVFAATRPSQRRP